LWDVLAAGKLRAAIDQIGDIVGNSFEEAEIADALLYYSFDREKTVSWLLDGETFSGVPFLNLSS